MMVFLVVMLVIAGPIGSDPGTQPLGTRQVDANSQRQAMGRGPGLLFLGRLFMVINPNDSHMVLMY